MIKSRNQSTTIKKEKKRKRKIFCIYNVKLVYIHIDNIYIYIYLVRKIRTATATITDRYVSVCCVLVTDKVQSLVDFNEVPAEENLPVVCQKIPGVPSSVYPLYLCVCCDQDTKKCVSSTNPPCSFQNLCNKGKKKKQNRISFFNRIPFAFTNSRIIHSYNTLLIYDSLLTFHFHIEKMNSWR